MLPPVQCGRWSQSHIKGTPLIDMSDAEIRSGDRDQELDRWQSGNEASMNQGIGHSAQSNVAPAATLGASRNNRYETFSDALDEAAVLEFERWLLDIGLRTSEALGPAVSSLL